MRRPDLAAVAVRAGCSTPVRCAACHEGRRLIRDLVRGPERMLTSSHALPNDGHRTTERHRRRNHRVNSCARVAAGMLGVSVQPSTLLVARAAQRS